GGLSVRPVSQLRPLVEVMAEEGRVIQLGASYVAREEWSTLEEATQNTLAEYHAAYPLRTGMPREELRSRLGVSARVFPHALTRLSGEGVLVDREGSVRLVEHNVKLTPEHERRAERMLAALGAQPFTPPSLVELPPEARLEPD